MRKLRLAKIVVVAAGAGAWTSRVCALYYRLYNYYSPKCRLNKQGVLKTVY